MRIISSRKFRFYSPDRSEAFLTEGKNIIQDCPDWAKEDDTFQAALAAGLIQIISSRAVQKVMEKEPEKIMPQNAHEAKALLDSHNEVHMDGAAKENFLPEDENPKEETLKKKRTRKRKNKE